jgi:ketosteroid isomerase-like protein
MMKRTIFLLSVSFLIFSCKNAVTSRTAEKEIFKAEKDFEKMAGEKGMSEAFYYFADESAVIRRNDSIIAGRDNIRKFYLKNANPNAKLTWTPDFVGVSDCGTLGYTYGKYVYIVSDSSGKAKEFRGIFHTVWKKTGDDWRYVWD